MVRWKRIDSGLYQRFDDGKPQNVYIDRVGRMSKSGKTLIIDGWMFAKKFDEKFEAMGEFWGTLREAKQALMDINGE